MQRLMPPKSPESPRPVTSPRMVLAGGGNSVRGGLVLSEPVARAMILKQKQSFSNLQMKCDTLARRQGKMQSMMDVMEYETRCLRVRALPSCFRVRCPGQVGSPAKAPLCTAPHLGRLERFILRSSWTSLTATRPIWRTKMICSTMTRCSSRLER